MNYEKRWDTYYELMEKLKEEAIAKHKTWDGVTVTISFEESIAKADRKEIEKFFHNELVESVDNFGGRSITVTFKERAIRDIIGDLYNYHDYRPDIWAEDTVIDEDESVKWNREQVKLHNDEEYASRDYSRQKRKILEQVYEQKVLQYGWDNLGKDTPEKALRVLYAKAYEEGHSGGYNDVYVNFTELVDMLEEYNKAVKEI